MLPDRKGGPTNIPWRIISDIRIGFCYFLKGLLGAYCFFLYHWESLLELVETSGPCSIVYLFFMKKAPSFL